MPVIPDNEFLARLNYFIADQVESSGSVFCGHWARYVTLERKFREETGFEPAPGSESIPRPSTFKSFIRKTKLQN